MSETPDLIDEFGNRYYGELKDGKPHGEGKMVYLKGQEHVCCAYGDDVINYGEYVGNWKDGKRHGQGTQIYDSGRSWMTDDIPIWDGCAHEEDYSLIDEYDIYPKPKYWDGVMVTHIYHHYCGKWENDMRHGYGVEKVLWHDFVIWGHVYKTYKGNWKNGVKEGEGELEVPCGLEHKEKIEDGFYMYEVSNIRYKTYETTWVDGKMNGSCILTDENGNKFKGDMVNNKEHGVFCSMKIYYHEGIRLGKYHPKIQKMLAEIEKNKLSTVLNKKVALGTKEDIGEILNSVGY